MKSYFLKVFERLYRANSILIFLIFLAGSLVLRLPFFFRDYIDRDESTFILMAQSLLDGYLPYTQLWDLKPPLLFVIFAIPIALFGKSLVAIRTLGWISVSLIAFYTYLIGKNTGNKATGLAAGIACMFLMSIGGSVQGVMSEHFSVLFLLPALLLLSKNPNNQRFFSAGVLIGLAVLCKSNLLLILPVLGIYLIYKGYVVQSKSFWVSLMLLVLGGLVVIVLSVLPYVISGQFKIWWDAVVQASLAYSNDAEISLGAILFYGLSGVLLWMAFRKSWLDRNNVLIQISALTLVGILLAFMKGGRLNGHYLLQFYPLALALLMVGIQKGYPYFPKYFAGGFFVWMLVLPVESYLEAFALLSHKKTTGYWYNGEGVEVPRYLNKVKAPSNQVFFLEYHIGYWFLNANPPTAVATHPSNICRDFLFPYIPGAHQNSIKELEYILSEKRPQIIVKREGKPVFDKQFDLENAAIESYLQVFYERDTVLGKAGVYLRR
jgi:4-amino-4-deoxy-L-arabinose transferase-like glycosyltransferase